MNSKLVTAALLSAISCAAFAQSSVALYGVMDAAVAIEDTGAPGNSRRTVLNSGNQSSSRLGFRGTEDLGDGLKALFNLEAGVNLDTGAADAAFWGRRAIVGLEGSFGLLTAGREYTPIAAIAGPTDVLGQGFYGSNLSAFTANRLTRRVSNSVNYKTPSFGGFKAGLTGSAGEGTDSRLIGVSGEYSNGPLFLGAGYHEVRRLTTGDDKEYAVGAGYNFGVFDVKANYLVADQTGPNNRFSQLNVGASVAVAKGRLYANFQRDRLENGERGNGVAVAYSYPLSRRTNLYSTYATMRNNATGLFGLNSASTAVNPPSSARGADPSVFVVGVRHTF